MPDKLYMKKLFFVLLSFILALVAIESGAAYFFGLEAKKNFYNMEAFLSHNHFVSYEVISYDQGIFKSEAVTKVKLKFLDDPNNLIKVKHTILHGPIILGASREKSLDFQMSVIKSEPMEMPAPYRLSFVSQTIFKFNKEVETHTTGEAFNIKDPAFQISSSAWSSDSNITNNWSTIKGQFVLPELTVSVLGMPINIKDIKFQFDQHRSESGEWLGDVSFNMGDALQKDQAAEIANLQVKEGAVLENQVLNITWGLELGKAILSNVVYGPIHFNLQILNIDPEGLKLLAVLKGDAVDKKIEEEAYLKILLKRPTIIIKSTSITLPQGNIIVDAQLSVGGPDITLPLNQEMVATTIDGYCHAIVPKEILQQGLLTGLTQEMLKDPAYQAMTAEQKKEALDQQVTLKMQKLIQEGVVVEKEKEYEIKINIVKGKWVVNGQEITKPLP